MSKIIQQPSSRGGCIRIVCIFPKFGGICLNSSDINELGDISLGGLRYKGGGG